MPGGRLVIAACVALLSAPPLVASPAAEATDRLLDQVEPRIRALVEDPTFRVRAFDATWLPDSTGFLRLETPEA